VRDGEYIRVPLVLMDQKMIDAFENGTKQLSLGYSCDIEVCDGVTPDGEPYDAIQRAIRINHLALVPLARGGDQLVLGDKKKSDPDIDEDEDDLDDEDMYDAKKKDDTDPDDDDDDDEDVEDCSYGKMKDGLHRTLDRDFSAKQRKSAASEGEAMPDGSFPIKSAKDLSNAIRLAGNAKDPDKARAFIKRRAKALGLESRIPDTWDAAPDYVACPQCGANVSPEAHECPGCGHIMMTRDHKGEKMAKSIIVDGLNVLVQDEQSASIVERTIEKLSAKVADLKDSREKAKTKSEELGVQLADAQKAVSAKDGEIAVLKKQLEDAKISPAKLDEMVKARQSVIDAATPLLVKGTEVADKSVEDIRRMAVTASLGEDAAKNMNDAAVEGAFAALTSGAKRSAGGVQPIRDALRAAPRQAVGDAKDTAWEERNKRVADAWRHKSA
jgi:hypothetical protein